MSSIVIPNIYTNGEVIDAGQLNANFSAVTAVVNGGIDNTNLSNSITIADSKLSQITSAAKVSGTALTGLASIPSGAGVVPAANLIYSNIQYPYVKVSETQASGTGPGSAVSMAWTNRVLNTIDTDTASISSLGSNQVTLPAGSYLVRVSSPQVNCNMQLRIQNITAGSTLLTGQGISNSASSFVFLVGEITLSTSSAIAVQYFCNTAGTGVLGTALSFTTEVYTVAEFTKIL